MYAFAMLHLSSRPLRRLVTLTSLAALTACSLTLENVILDGSRDNGAADGSAVGDSLDMPAPTDSPTDVPADVADAVDAIDAPAEIAADAPVDSPDTVDVPADTCATNVERCNGLDDNCNGQVDEGIAPVVCGVGVCRRTVPGCTAGMINACSPGSPQIEICNGLDDNCNGTMDEALTPVACGVGACAVTVAACGDMGPNRCVPGAPVREICGNSIDDDCDGTVDDGCHCDLYVSEVGSFDPSAGASPSNPAATVAHALRLASTISMRPLRVCVAATPNGGRCGFAYLESVTMLNDVSVYGGYRSDTWVRDGTCSTNVTAPYVGSSGLAPAVTFPTTIVSAGTTFDGFTVGHALPALGLAAVGATVVFSGTGVLSNNTIFAPSTTLTSIGVNMAPSTGAIPATPPLVTQNSIVPPANGVGSTAVGVRTAGMTGARIVSNVQILAGNATSRSAGVWVEGTTGVQITNNANISGGTVASSSGGAMSVGVLVTLASDGLVVARNAIVTGGPALIESNGVRMDGATGTVTVWNNTLLAGGTGTIATSARVVGTSIGTTSGVLVLASNINVEARASAGNQDRTVWCSNPLAQCRVVGNARISGAPSGVGSTNWNDIVFDSGTPGLIIGNRLAGCASGCTDAAGIALNAAGSVLVERNVIDTQVAVNGGLGIFTQGTATLIQNNFVAVSTGSGIFVNRAGPAGAQALVHSNTVVGVVVPTGATRDMNLLVCVFEGSSAGPAPLFRNNIAVCTAPSSLTRHAFRELGALGDPGVFQNNELFGCDVAYQDVETGAVNNIATINAFADIPTNGGNVAMPPGFVGGGDFHLAGSSGLIDRGSGAAGLPALDFDGNARPARTAPDIGCDEVP